MAIYDSNGINHNALKEKKPKMFYGYFKVNSAEFTGDEETANGGLELRLSTFGKGIQKDAFMELKERAYAPLMRELSASKPEELLGKVIYAELSPDGSVNAFMPREKESTKMYKPKKLRPESYSRKEGRWC
jgi:hypothetical protein